MDPVPPSRPPRRWALVLALAGSVLLNLGLIYGGVRQWRQRHRLELRLARLEHPWGTRLPDPALDGGVEDTGKGKGKRGRPRSTARPASKASKASSALELVRERRARQMLAAPTSPVVELRPDPKDAKEAKDPKAPAGTPDPAPRGRVIFGERGGMLAAGLVGLAPSRRDRTRELRLYVQRKGATALQYVGTLKVDPRGKTDALFDVPHGAAIEAVEIRRVPREQPTSNVEGERVLAGSAAGK